MPWLSIGASLVGGLLQSDAASSAAGAQQGATDAAIGENRRQFDLVRGDTATARGVGNNALLRYSRIMGLPYNGDGQPGSSPLGVGGGQSSEQLRTQLLPQFTGPATAGGVGGGDASDGHYMPGNPGTVDEAGLNAAIQQRMQQGQQPAYDAPLSDQERGVIDPTQDPGYQFGRDQGQLGLDRKIAAMGGRVSGRALIESSKFNQNYATTGYGAAYQRGQDRLNRLGALAGIGQTATNASAAAGANSTNAISGLISSQGDARGASRLAQGNIWGNTGNQLAALYGRSSPGNLGYGSYGAGTPFNADVTIPMQPGGGY